MNPRDTIDFEEIRERAYDLWDRHHRPEGFELHFWLMAERDLRAERANASLFASKSGDASKSEHRINSD